MIDPFTVVVFGPVGVGKSTIVRTLATSGEHVHAVVEPVDAMVDSGALNDLYKGLPSSGYRLQMLVLAERLASYWRVAPDIARTASLSNNNSKRPVIVSDGHITLDGRIFIKSHVERGVMSRAEVGEYNTATSVIHNNCPVFMHRPDLYIYLEGSAITCRMRSAKRGRREETQLDLTFFQRMCLSCDDVAFKLQYAENQSVVVINSDYISIDEVITQAKRAIDVHLTS